MRETYAERTSLPHCVYRLFNADGELLYIGCSMMPLSRVGTHTLHREWNREVTKATFEWFRSWILGRHAEMRAIVEENPKYNNRKHHPDRVGSCTDDMRALRATGRTRGLGLNCPRCGNPKEHRERSYCADCQRAYVRSRYKKSPVGPNQPLTTITDDGGTTRTYRDAAAMLGADIEVFKMRLYRMRAAGISQLTYEQLRKLQWRVPGHRKNPPEQL